MTSNPSAGTAGTATGTLSVPNSDLPTVNNAGAGEPPKGPLASALSFTQGLVPLLVAIAVLWFFGTTLKKMFDLAAPTIDNETLWGRYVYLFGGLEVMAYAATGFLFGREVNRQRAEQAEKRAATAQDKADIAQVAAARSVANGQALAEAVRELTYDQAEQSEAARAETALVEAAAARTQIRTLRRLANKYFPAR